MPAVDFRAALRFVALASGATLVVAACTADQTMAGSRDERTRTGKIAQDLQSTNFIGTSLPNKVLALTFDDGPGDRTIELSQYLKAEGIKAGFFMNGARFHAPMAPLQNKNNIAITAGGPAILAQVKADGHLVANHTTTHRDLQSEVPNAQLVQEVAETDGVISAYVSPANHLLFRAPYGSFSSNGNGVFNTLSASAMNKYIGPIYWEAGGFDTGYPNKAADWACWQGALRDAGGALVNIGNDLGYATTTQCGDAYLTEINAFGQGIVLMHDPYSWSKGGASGSTVDMVKYLVPKLKAAGYTFVRIDEVPAIRAALPCDTTCATCSGPDPDQCKTCPAGRYKSGSQCLACTTCGAGEYQTTACSANADTVCTACTACGANQYEVSACSPTANRVCAACSPSCATCTGPAATQCASCAGNEFLSGTSCTACTSCGAGKYPATACTPTQDTVCASCHASCLVCSGPNADQCGTCPPGAFNASGKCSACAVCAAGSFAQTACGGTSDTKCTPCEAGTFAAAAAATSCTPCAAGTTSRPGATLCTACGSCGDASLPDGGGSSSGNAGDASGETDAGGDPVVNPSGCSVSPSRSSDVGRTGRNERGIVALVALGAAVVMRRRKRDAARATD
jgi:MYXO-CTERM domain-containing protein